MIQRSQNKNSSASNRNENLIVDDIRELVSAINNQSPGVTSDEIMYLNGFKVTSCLSENITLPSNTTLEYDGPLSMCSGYSITIPSGTTLNII